MNPTPKISSDIQSGRPFINQFYDLALIGGGLSLVTVFTFEFFGLIGTGAWPSKTLPWFVILANTTHFAASTVRLYTKPGSFDDLPFLTMGFPLITFSALTLAIVFSDIVGYHFYALYLSWSPYHYAAQTFGLVMIYTVRSGIQLSSQHRSFIWWTCMLPFFYAFVSSPRAGLEWFLPREFWTASPNFSMMRSSLQQALSIAVFAVPIVLAMKLYRDRKEPLPIIAWLLILTNGIWWIGFEYLGAFGWATVFHGVQYLALITIFYVRDHPGVQDGHSSASWTAFRFLLICLILGYTLFEIWPYAYVAAGFTLSESSLLCTATINIHHFIVDRGIWRLRRGSNQRIISPQAGVATT